MGGLGKRRRSNAAIGRGYAALYPGAFVYGGNTGKKKADYKELMSEAGGPRLPGLRDYYLVHLAARLYPHAKLIDVVSQYSSIEVVFML